MSIASRIEAIEQHLTDDYSVLEIAGADLTNVNKNILNLKSTWQERLLYFMNNGTDVVWNNWDKVIGEGTTLTLNNTLEGKMKIVLKGNTSQEGTPTPETPQDIHVVSGDNSIVVCGKNLASTDWASDFVSAVNNTDLAKIETKDGRNCLMYVQNAGYGDYPNKNLTLGMTFKENTQYTVSFDIYKINSTARTVGIRYTDGSYTTPSNLNATDTWEHQSVTSTAGKTIDYICPYYTAGNTYIDIDTWQIEEGTTATTYEAYKGASYHINLGNIELCKIGDYQDSIVKDNGKWYFKKEIGKLDNDIVIISYNSTYKYYTITPNITGAGAKTYSSTLSTHFQKTGPLRIVGSNSTNLWLWDENNYFQNATEIKQFMINNNVKTYYILNTPTYTEITDSTLLSQLEALKKARSYDGQTNITQTNNDLPFIINATALKEMA